MKMPNKKIQLWIFATSLILTTLVLAVNFTEACRLQEILLDEKPQTEWSGKYNLKPNRAMLSQSVNELTDSLLARSNVHKVDISYSWPGCLDITTNKFEPACFILDIATGRLVGCDRTSRIVSLDKVEFDWERPILTGIKAGRLYSFSSDVRVQIIIDQLEELRESNIDLYRLVEEIDLSDHRFLSVRLVGWDCKLKVPVLSLASEVERGVGFVEAYTPDLEGVRAMDMRYDGTIICSRRNR